MVYCYFLASEAFFEEIDGSLEFTHVLFGGILLDLLFSLMGYIQLLP
jgi:hypothetical protein